MQLGVKVNLIHFEVKGQGHNKTKCGQRKAGWEF